MDNNTTYSKTLVCGPVWVLNPQHSVWQFGTLTNWANDKNKKPKSLRYQKKLHGWWGNCAQSLISTIVCRKMGKSVYRTSFVLHVIKKVNAMCRIFCLFIYPPADKQCKVIYILYFILQLINFDIWHLTNFYIANIIYFLLNFFVSFFDQFITKRNSSKWKRFLEYVFFYWILCLFIIPATEACHNKRASK